MAPPPDAMIGFLALAIASTSRWDV